MAGSTPDPPLLKAFLCTFLFSGTGCSSAGIVYLTGEHFGIIMGHMATPNPRAIPIYNIACVVTFGQAAGGKRFIFENTIKECVSVTANCRELVFGDRNREPGEQEPLFRVI